MNRRTALQSAGAALGLLFDEHKPRAGTPPAAAASEFILAGGGKSLCSIVVDYGDYASPEEASAASDQVDWFADAAAATRCTESFAALELRRFLCALTALDPNDFTHFPIRHARDGAAGSVIILGNEHSNRQCAPYRSALGMDWANPHPEAFRIKTVRNKDGFALLLAGHDRSGTLYAAYEFLNRCGVRWFSPTLNGEVVPHRTELGIPALDVTDAPQFSVRGYWAEFFDPQHDYVVLEGKKGTVDFFNWMARNRMNLWNAGERGVPLAEILKRGIRLTSFGQPIWTLLDPSLPYPYRHARFSGGQNKPPDPYPVSPDYRGDVNGDGILSYSEAHPEWYGQDAEGKRQFPVDPFGYDYCTSNRDMVTEFTKNMIEKLQKEYKWAEWVEWVPEDERNRWCQCANCRALGTPTDRNLLMAHHLREGLKRALADGTLKRDVGVNFIIYPAANVLDPPTRPLPAGFDYEHILGTLFPIHRCYVHSLDDPACTEFNRPYAEHFAAWLSSPFYHGKFMVGEFYNVSGFRDLPILFTHAMEHDIRYYHRNGVRAMHYMHIPMANWGTRAATNCQYARMLWNPAVDLPAFLEEYFRLRYEDAAAHMRALYAALEQTMIIVPEYDHTPANYNYPPGKDPTSGYLARALNYYAAGKTKDLFPFRHLRMAGEHPPPDNGPALEDTVKYLAQTERLMDQALTLPVSPRVRACILEDEALFRYAAATIRLYYHMAKSTEHPLKLPAWQREIRLAGLQAEYLDSHPIGFVAVAGGTVGMMRNALECTGVRQTWEKWKALMA